MSEVTVIEAFPEMLTALYRLSNSASVIDGDVYFDTAPSKAKLAQLAGDIAAASAAIKLAEVAGTRSQSNLVGDELLIWLLGDLMNAAENYFGAENPKRLGHINCTAARIIDEIITPIRGENERQRRVIEQRELGWLIETGDHKYWNGKYANTDGFTHDANDAVRFARFEDSERIIYWLMQQYSVFLRSSQHMWIEGRERGSHTSAQGTKS